MMVDFNTYGHGINQMIINAKGGITCLVKLGHAGEYSGFGGNKSKALEAFYQGSQADTLSHLLGKLRESNPGVSIRIRDEDGELHDLVPLEKPVDDDATPDSPRGGVPLGQQNLSYNAQSGHWQGMPQ